MEYQAEMSPQDPGIVVGVDGSSESVRALAWAAALAPTFNASITAIMAWHFEPALGSHLTAEWDPKAAAEEVLADTLTEAFGAQGTEHLIVRCLKGHPAQVLLEQGRNACMMIVGSHGRGGFAGRLLGSVSRTCVEHARCPVLVVRQEMPPPMPPRPATPGK